MKSIKLAILLGFLLWAIPFIVAFIIYPLKQKGSPFFETIMAVVLTICAVIFSIIYMKGIERGSILEGIKLGIFWFLMSLIIDLFMFMWGSMKMTFVAYMTDIGLTYLIYPTVTIGFGVMLRRK